MVASATKLLPPAIDFVSMRNTTRRASLLIIVLTYALAAQAPNLIAPTPPMGWNSWDSYGLTVSQGEFLANADYMTANLRQHGWQYAVVDEGWFLRNPEAKPPQKLEYTMDEYGRFTPAVSRFPGAGGDVGFRK